MRGPKPNAASLTVVRGGGTGAAKGVRVEPAAPKQPDFGRLLGHTKMSRSAAVEWRRVVPELERVGLIGLLDARLLTDYCICVVQLDAANVEIATKGFGVVTERGEQKNPAVTAANQLRTQLKFYISELGLSPTSRMRLNMPKGDDGDSLDLD